MPTGGCLLLLWAMLAHYYAEDIHGMVVGPTPLSFRGRRGKGEISSIADGGPGVVAGRRAGQTRAVLQMAT